MKRLFLLLLLASVVASAAPQRIVSAAPSITEMLYALGLGDRVVGVTTYCHYPPEVRAKPKIGSYLRPDIETVLAMRPDLIVVLREHGELGERFRRLNLPVLALRHNDLDGIYESLRDLAERTGVPERAEQKIAEIRGRLDAVRIRAQGLPRRSVVFFVGRSPGTISDLVAVGKGSFLNDLIDIAGGHNYFADAATFYPRIPREEIYAGRPEVVVDMGDMSDTDKVSEAHRLSVGKLWEQTFPDIPAVREGRVHAVANDIFVVPGPRVAETAEALFRMIHPEAVE